jgi:hypothetical protein
VWEIGKRFVHLAQGPRRAPDLFAIVVTNRVMLDVRPKRHSESIMKVRASGMALAGEHYRCIALAKVPSYFKLAAE